jgi:hypothetical protein
VPIIGRLEITLDDAGGVNVSGSISNKVFAYGLLELAKEAIKAHNDQASRLVRPSGPTILQGPQ